MTTGLAVRVPLLLARHAGARAARAEEQDIGLRSQGRSEAGVRGEVLSRRQLPAWAEGEVPYELAT